MKKQIITVMIMLMLFFTSEIAFSIDGVCYADRQSIKASEVASYMNGQVGQPNKYKGLCLAYVVQMWVNLGFPGTYNWGTADNFASQNTVSTSKDNIPIGADVYFTSPDGNGHIGIYVGDSYFVHAGSQDVYEKSNISETYWDERYTGWGWHPGVTVIDDMTCTEHNWDNGVITTEATCTTDGIKTYTCKNCGETKTETIPGGHKYKAIITVKATFLADGYKGEQCTVCGDAKQETIYKPESFELSRNTYTFNGKKKTPKVIIKDINGNAISNKYYNISYKDNAEIGIATATIKFKGDYSGSKKLKYKIIPKGVSAFKLKTNKKAIVVRWKKQSKRTDGYQIQYSNESNYSECRTITVKGCDNVKKTISGTLPETKYYVRMRTYKIAHKKKIFSMWSETKSVETPCILRTGKYTTASIYCAPSNASGDDPTLSRLYDDFITLYATPSNGIGEKKQNMTFKDLYLGGEWIDDGKQHRLFYQIHDGEKIELKTDISSSNGRYIYGTTGSVLFDDPIYLYKTDAQNGKTKKLGRIYPNELGGVSGGVTKNTEYGYYNNDFYYTGTTNDNSKWLDLYDLSGEKNYTIRHGSTHVVKKFSEKDKRNYTVFYNIALFDMYDKYMIYCDSYIYDSKIGDWTDNYCNVNKIRNLKTGKTKELCDYGFAKFANGNIYYVDYEAQALFKCKCDGSKEELLVYIPGARDVIFADNYSMYVVTLNGIYKVDLENESASMFIQ